MASVLDKITDVRNAARPNSARVTSPRSSGGVSLSCDNLAGWPTASKVHFVTYTIDSNSNPVVGTQLDCYGIVSSNTITSFTVVDGSDNGNQVADVVEMLPTAAWGQDLADALTASHNRDGTPKSGITYPASTFTTPTLDIPVITDFTTADHTHGSVAQGGQLVGSTALTNSSVTADKLATGAATAFVATSEGRSNAGYAALPTASAVTVTIGANGLALVSISIGLMYDDTTNGSAHMSFALSGANTQAATDAYSISVLASSNNVPQIGTGATFLLTGLTAGATTFATQFRSAGADIGVFANRRIAVVPL